ncbi:MAG TPA: hypothetical protein PLQ11_10285 [Beijerinckiaceae bacterium]|mgnify:CR=1 FL=1|nr:hypothetical protein [Beijerinckiaceae bacterium]
MGKEPDNLVLSLLREMRGDLSDIKEKLSDHSRQFKRIRKEMADWQETSATATGFAVHANVRHDGVDKRIDELADRIERLEKAK